MTAGAALLRGWTTLALEQRDPAVTTAGLRAGVATCLEASVYLVLALVVLNHRRVRRALCGMNRATASVAAVLLAGALFAQLAKVSFYPLAPWTMYSATMPSCAIEYYEYVGVHADGRRTAVNPATLFPTLGDALEVKLGHLAGDGTALSGPAFCKLEGAIRALAVKFNDACTDDPITTLHVYLASFDHRSGPDTARRKLIFTVGAV